MSIKVIFIISLLSLTVWALDSQLFSAVPNEAQPPAPTAEAPERNLSNTLNALSPSEGDKAVEEDHVYYEGPKRVPYIGKSIGVDSPNFEEEIETFYLKHKPSALRGDSMSAYHLSLVSHYCGEPVAEGTKTAEEHKVAAVDAAREMLDTGQFSQEEFDYFQEKYSRCANIWPLTSDDPDWTKLASSAGNPILKLVNIAQGYSEEGSKPGPAKLNSIIGEAIATLDPMPMSLVFHTVFEIDKREPLTHDQKIILSAWDQLECRYRHLCDETVMIENFELYLYPHELGEVEREVNALSALIDSGKIAKHDFASRESQK